MMFLNTLLNISGDLEIDFDPMQFVNYLSYMGRGMLVIFVIIGVIVLLTALINKMFSK